MKKLVWILRIRLLHWLMALFIAINLFIFNEGGLVHFWIGYGTLAILFIRIYIGFTSTGYDSFKNFPMQFNELIFFFKNLLNKNRVNYIGHNPIASYAYLIFWLLVLGLGVTGILLEYIDMFFGDELIENTHELLAKAIIVFLFVHFVGMLIDSIIHHRKTWMSMITGRK